MLGRQLGHFRIEGPLGAGGMGEVYRARDTRLDREGEVVRALGESLTPQEASAVGRVPTKDLAAYDLFLRANRIAASSYDARDSEEAVRLLSEAVPRDARFAEAHARLARQDVADYWFYRDRSPACLERARLSAERAVALAPDIGETRLALGHDNYMAHLDYDRALAEASAALRLRPNDPEAMALQAYVHRRAGRVEETARILERVVGEDSGSADKWHNLGETYWLLRRYSEAGRAWERALALNPRWGRVYTYRAAVCLCRGGSVDAARALIQQAPAGPELLEAD